MKDFFTLNAKKFLPIFLLCLGIFFVIGFCIYSFSSIRHRNDIGNKPSISIIFIWLCFGVFYFLYTYLINRIRFYFSRKLMKTKILPLTIFDKNIYTIQIKNQFIWYRFVKECYVGNILGYPTIINIVSGSRSTSILFNICLHKFNRVYIEHLHFRLGYNGFDKDIKQQVLDFVANLKSKGYEKADLSNGIEGLDL